MALIVDHEERVSMLKSLINEYNSVYSNIPAIMTPARHTFVLICIICRINGLLSPYVGSISSGSIDDWQEDNSFIFKTIHMTGIIKQQLGVETDDELFGLMKTKLSEIHMDRSSSNVASPVPIREKLIKTRSVENCARVVSMLPRSSSGKKLQMMNAKAKEFIPRPMCTSV